MNRKVTIVLGVVVLVIGFGLYKYLSSLAELPKKSDLGENVPAVLAQQVIVQEMDNRIEISGKLMAEKRVEIYSEVTGVLLSGSKLFKEGVSYSSGETMLKVDSTEFYLNLMAAKSSYLNMLVQLGPDIKYDFPESYEAWSRYVSNINIENEIPPVPATKDQKARNFLTSRDVYNQYYQIKSQEEKLRKFNLRAPFNGVLAEGNLHAGSMIRVGQKLGTLIRPGLYELDAAVQLADANFMKIGDSVRLQSANVSGEWLGTVKRISQHIDRSTQTVKVYITVQTTDLREGMYLSGVVLSAGFDDAFAIPRNLLQGTNKVYTINDSILNLVEVEVLKLGESEVVVKGLKNGDLLLNQVFSGAYNGLKVSPQYAAQ